MGVGAAGVGGFEGVGKLWGLGVGRVEALGGMGVGGWVTGLAATHALFQPPPPSTITHHPETPRRSPTNPHKSHRKQCMMMTYTIVSALNLQGWGGNNGI